MKTLKISDIRIDGGTQPRLKLDLDLVKEYAELMRDGAEFPPIDVFFDGSEYWLGAGFNRLHAIKSNGHIEIECNIINGTLREAKRYSWRSNNKHGKPLTAEEKRNIIRMMLEDEEYGQWSNNKIAKDQDVSSMTVGRVRIAMEEEKKQSQPKERKFIDKEGNEKTMDTSNVGKKSKPKDEPKEEVNEEEEYDPAEEKMQELMDTITHLADENTLLRDKIAIGQWDASEIEKIDAEETIKNLREQVRILEIDNHALRESRDMFQNRNAELIKTVNSLKKKLQKGA